MLCYVTRHDPNTWKAGEAVPIEAASKQEAAEKVCGFRATGFKPGSEPFRLTCQRSANADPSRP